MAFTWGSVTGKTGFAATGVTSNDFWNTYGLNSGGLPNLQFVNGTASGAGLTVANFLGTDNGACDPMYQFCFYWPSGNADGNMTVTVTNLIAGRYDFYLYGHGYADNQNSVFQLTAGSQGYGSEATTNGSGWLCSAWQEGVQYVEFTNVIVTAGQTITITVEPGAGGYAVLSGLQMVLSSGAYIVTQPTNQQVGLGATATFSVVAGGAPPLAYQWLFNSANIPMATNTSYILTNAQLANIGAYSVIVTNAYGSVTSTVAGLIVVAPVATVIDVAVTRGSVTTKTGFAASGLTTTDFWNTCAAATINAGGQGSGGVSNLKFVDGTASGAGLTVANAHGAYGNGASDPMYGSYLYSAGTITVTVTNLSEGVYDFYLYGHGNVDNQNSVFQLTVGSQSYGSEATTNGPGWLSSIWQEGVQYVEFTDVIVTTGQTITVTVEPGASTLAVLSGLQMATVILPTNSPPLIINTSNQFVNVNHEVIITNFAFSANGPISFTLTSNAPPGARISADGVFTWAPTCEQGSTTNLITVWAMDSSSPPRSNSMTFSVSVADCVEVSIGSSVVQAGQSTCVPVSLVTSVGLTNLNFTLDCPAGFLTNWSITSTNPVIASATVQMTNAYQPQFSFGVQSGSVLQGATVLGSVCLEAMPVSSAFVPLLVSNFSGTTSNNAPKPLSASQAGRVVLVGNQPLLEGAIGTNSHRLLLLYGNPGVSYELLSTTNIANPNSWSTLGSVTLTQLVQTASMGSATNPVQFFQAVQH